MSSMLTIDFGNSFTKVSVRARFDTRTELLRDSSLNFEELNICIPSRVAQVTKSGTTRWLFGNEVEQVHANSPGVRILANWKPQFFKGVQSRLSNGSPRDPVSKASPATQRTRSGATAVPTHAQKVVLGDADWTVVKRILNLEDEDRIGIESVCAKRAKDRNDQLMSHLDTDEETDMDVKALGLGFFRWLREFVNPFCLKQGLGPVESIPARITLPSFSGSMTKSELLLREILVEAGWKLADKATTLPEPLANALGIFTEGVNATHRPRKSTLVQPNYGEMFKQTGLLHVMREAILADGPKTSWVLIADLGGYTLDFAMVGLDLEDIESRFEGTIQGLPRIATYSEPIGVTDLDRRVSQVLDPAKKLIFSDLMNDSKLIRLESLHSILYGKLRPVRFRGTLIGEGAEFKRISETIEKFAAEIADCAEQFLDVHQYRKIDDLILTGGGMMIPAIRQSLEKKLKSAYEIRKIHTYTNPNEARTDSTHRMDEKLVRGATAIGGSSVYFDFAE